MEGQGSGAVQAKIASIGDRAADLEAELGNGLGPKLQTWPTAVAAFSQLSRQLAQLQNSSDKMFERVAVAPHDEEVATVGRDGRGVGAERALQHALLARRPFHGTKFGHTSTEAGYREMIRNTHAAIHFACSFTFTYATMSHRLLHL